MSDEIIAAIIGASVALVGIILRDIAFKLWERSKTARESSIDVFRRYADPLVGAAASLLWRLDEILNREGRGSYLQESRKTRYAAYKRLSTSYRIAAMLGWIRAFRRELSFLRPLGAAQLSGIRDSISSFESALADGAHLELRRLDSLLDLWRGSFPGDPARREAAAAALDQEFREFLLSAGTGEATGLDEEQQQQLCRTAAGILASHFDTNRPSDAVLAETCARAMECLTLREAWLYRDWQVGIGDLMIESVEGAERRFDVIGYGAFEAKFGPSPAPDLRLWADRLKAVTEDLDVSGTDPRETRVDQLRKTLEAVAKLILAIVAEDQQQRELLSRTISLAEKFAALVRMERRVERERHNQTGLLNAHQPLRSSRVLIASETPAVSTNVIGSGQSLLGRGFLIRFSG